MEAVFEVVILEAVSAMVRLVISQLIEWWRERQPNVAFSLA